MASRPRRILVVEDNESMAELLRRRLEAWQFEVHVEGRGTAALSHMADHQPDLVILDLRLPDMNGYEVCRQMRRLYPRWEVPVLMLTGMDQPVDQLRGFACGADAYLTKPYQSEELLSTISLLLGENAPA